MTAIKKKQILTVLLVCSALLGLLFTTRFVSNVRQFGAPPGMMELTDPALVRGWMSIEYISSAYHIPKELLASELALKPGQERIPIRALARESQGSSEQTIIEQTRSIISRFQSKKIPEQGAKP